MRREGRPHVIGTDLAPATPIGWGFSVLTVNFPVRDDLPCVVIFLIFLFIAIAVLATLWDIGR